MSKFFVFILFLFSAPLSALQLVDRLQEAEEGDYIATAIDKAFSVLFIKEKIGEVITLEEVTIPIKRLKMGTSRQWKGWKQWVADEAPGHTSWMLYTLHAPTGALLNVYSYENARWYLPSDARNLFSKLLNLQIERLPKKDLRRTGRDKGRYWTPKMVYEGQIIEGVAFDAWQGFWPKDGGDLSGKKVLIYLPQEGNRYPTYFPYWLEVEGTMGKGKVRIIDSGRSLQSPRVPQQVTTTITD